MLGKNKATLCFISKDDLCLQEYTFILNDKWQAELDNELGSLRKYWDEFKNGTLPPAQPRAYKDKKGGFKECQYCSWKKLCEGKNG